MTIRLTPEDKDIIERSKERGWILEPDAKTIFEHAGLELPRRVVTDDFEKAAQFMESLSTPVVVKAVSGSILHKTEYNAVALNIHSRKQLKGDMERLLALEGCNTVLVEEMVTGVELFVGAKNDAQFGPVVILGMGGTGVEIYNDTAVRMAPLTEGDVLSMAGNLKAAALLTGFRGGSGIDMKALCSLVVRFSHLAMAMEADFQSMDLNPVICSAEGCAVADARIMLIT
ncbi:MAG: acetate--CoA ligase family protein [Desulfobacterales bacterium]|nr:acetate--CoA ligase family protein [Desulfobacterales bacterium]